MRKDYFVLVIIIYFYDPNVIPKQLIYLTSNKPQLEMFKSYFILFRFNFAHNFLWYRFSLLG